MSDGLKDNIMEDEDTQKNKFLIFTTGSEIYGIDIKYVTEIIGIQPITEIPELPEYIKGIINLRGKIIPVMDVRLKFKRDIIDYNDRTCIVVINVNEISIGLIVDSVSEVLTILEDKIVDPPEISKQNNRYIKGIGKTNKEVVLLLDSEKLLSNTEIEELEHLN
ncbi:purine-binding chemotaxis protein CheW [Natranaerovirga pectinivora]|uniref:Chemotaxis protein CheW n=1 Tax=Natranaerovirga pectinivora TaxID=682400 RepID=A0A4R3MF48_9FIRM|nr:chemotaxis protein CheW [Natranaerovirga pectinivora]TCT12136.1 purine-binding chemotaxis protein CheW [Natranaerovirga pectinivora]